MKYLNYFLNENIETDFLKKVKETTPESYNVIYTIYKNHGLEAAKEKYNQIDPILLKQKEKENKKSDTKLKAKEKINNMKKLLPNKGELINIIDSKFLDDELRTGSLNMNIPQLVASTIDLTNKVNQTEAFLKVSLTSDEKYDLSKGIGVLQGGIKNNVVDDILDKISKRKEEYKADKYIKKYLKNHFDEYDILPIKDIIISSFLTINISITYKKISVYAEFGCDMKSGYDKSNVFKEFVYKRKYNFDIKNLDYIAEINKEEVINLIIDTLIKLKYKVINNHLSKN